MEITRKEALEKRGAEKTNCSAQHAVGAKYTERSTRERRRGQAQPRPAPACAATGRCGKRFPDHSYVGGKGSRLPRNTAKRHKPTPPALGARSSVQRWASPPA